MRLTMASPMPVPGKCVAVMQPLEHAEQLRNVPHVESGAIVLHEVDGLIVAASRADLDP